MKYWFNFPTGFVRLHGETVKVCENVKMCFCMLLRDDAALTRGWA
jgi:hypothetical protein